ncbi:MAG: hypothetical protein ACQESB_03955 [Elusimicrobiota bacterium]
MMKRSTKRALAIAGILVLGIIVFWGIQYRFSVPSIGRESLINYVPSRLENMPAAGLAGVRNAPGVFRNLKRTNFYRAFKESSLPSEGLGSDVLEKVIADTLVGEIVAGYYENREGEKKHLAISYVRDPGGIKEKVLGHMAESASDALNYGGVEIKEYSEDIFYVFDGELLMASDSRQLLKKSISLKKNEGEGESFIQAMPWIETVRDKKGDIYVFSLQPTHSFILQKFLGADLDLSFSDEKEGYYREIYMEKEGLKVNSFTPSEKDEAVLERADSIKIMPSNLAFMYARLDTGPASFMDSLFGDYEEIEISNDSVNEGELLKGEISFALMPSSPDEDLIPGALIMGEYSQGAFDKTRSFLEDSLNVSFKDASVDGFEYSFARVPLFFTSFNLSLGVLESEEKEFIVAASSRGLLERVRRISEGEYDSFSRSSAWMKIENYIPSRYCSIYYIDSVSVSSSLKLIAALLGRGSLVSFVSAGPFGWLSPAGGAGFKEEGYSKTVSYIPLRDLEFERWMDIMAEFEDMLF